MYKKYKILIYLILFILIMFFLNFFFKNHKKLEKYSTSTDLSTVIQRLRDDINNEILIKHQLNQTELQKIIDRINVVIGLINDKIKKLDNAIEGQTTDYVKLLEESNQLLNDILNLKTTIENQEKTKANNIIIIQDLQNQINNLHEIKYFLINYKRYDGETIDPFTNNQIVLYNSDGNVINDNSKFNLSNLIKIKIGNQYLKKTNMYYVKQGNSPSQTKIQSTEKLPDIPQISWLNIMGYQKVKEITTGNTISNPNGESICAFAVWPNWGSTWNNTNKTNLPTTIQLQNSDGTVLFSKTITTTQRLLDLDVNYWKEIFVSNAHNEDRCQVYFIPSINTSREFRIVHNGSISRCAILKNNNGNNNCKFLSITFGRQCTRERPNGAFNVNGQTQSYTGLTNPRTFNFTLTERLYHFGGSFTNDKNYEYPVWRWRYRKRWRRYCWRHRRWRRCKWNRTYYWRKTWKWEKYKKYYRCDSNVRIHSMNLPGYNLFSNTVTSRRQTLINQTKLHWRLSPNRHSKTTPVFAWGTWGRRGYYYKILNYNNALRTLAGDYKNYLNNRRTQLINFTSSSEFLNYNQSNGLIEYRIRKSLYNQYNFTLTSNFSDATSFILECHNNTGTNLCNIEPEILRMNRKYKIKTLSEGTYVKDLNNILSDIGQSSITRYPDNDIINNTNSTPYLLNL
jgi:hypothetical protein